MKNELPMLTVPEETWKAAISNDLPELMAKAADDWKKRIDSILLSLAGAFTLGAIIVLVYALLSIQ